MMIVAAWLVYCVLIAGLLTLGAIAWERSARWSGRPARWSWLAALSGSVALPWLLRLVPERGWVEGVPAAATMLRLDPLVVSATNASVAAWSATDVAIALWLGASVAMVVYVGVLFARLMRLSRRWRVAELDGGPVLMTRTIGPAALGVRRGMVVLPSWVMDLDADLRSLLLRHERAHVEAGDPRLLLAGLVLLAAMPWNPVVWFQVLRLRNAIELDCDARVLSTGADPVNYGALLLEVGRRRSSHALVMATFAEPRVFMEQRIRRIAQWPLERRRGRAAVFATAALFLFVTALSARDPLPQVVEMSDEVSAAAAASPERTAADLVAVTDTPPQAPTFTPMTVAPELLNRAEVSRALEASYPPLLREAGIGGSPTVHFYIDSLGVLRRTLLAKSSEYPALDEAALNVAQSMKFSPAMNRDRRVNVWVEIPIVFTASESPRPSPPNRRPTPLGERVSPPRQASSQARQATEVDVKPELTNRDEVARALVDAYPPLLRDAGIGGAPVIWFLIGEDGTVRETELATTSGYPVLDEAALQVAGSMRFTPAQNGGRPTQAWVQIPIVFTTQ